MWQIWLIIAGVCLVAEIMTLGFLIFWFAVGALIAMITSFFTDNIIVQSTVFVISSTILLFATKPFVRKFIDKKNPVKTNVFSLVGKIGIVTEEINSITSTGLVKIEGELWSAIGENDSNISKGVEVKVVEIKGVKAVVSPITVTSNN